MRSKFTVQKTIAQTEKTKMPGQRLFSVEGRDASHAVKGKYSTARSFPKNSARKKNAASKRTNEKNSERPAAGCGGSGFRVLLSYYLTN